MESETKIRGHILPEDTATSRLQFEGAIRGARLKWVNWCKSLAIRSGGGGGAGGRKRLPQLPVEGPLLPASHSPLILGEWSTTTTKTAKTATAVFFSKFVD